MKKIVYTILLIILAATTILSKDLKLSKLEKLWFNGEIAELKRHFKNPNTSSSLYNLAYLEMLSGNFNKALSLSEQLVKENNKWYHDLKGQILYTMKDYKSAIPELLISYEEDAGDLHKLLRLGNAYIETLDFEKARLSLLDRIDDFDNERISALIAISFLKEGKKDEAVRWLLEAEKKYPGMDILWNLVEIYHQGKNPQKVLEYGIRLATYFSGSVHQEQLENIFKANNLSLDMLSVKNPAMAPLEVNVGELTEYDVSYGIFHLGTLKIEVSDSMTFNNNRCLIVDYQLDTAAGIPFFTMHHKYRTILDKSSMTAHQSLAFTDASEGINRRSNILDYQNHLLKSYYIDTEDRIAYVERPLPNVAVDALSLLFYARQMVKNRVSGTVTTIIEGNFKTADIFYENKSEKIEILEQDVDSKTVYAKANFTGIAGMTGDVWGWFVDTDVSAVPAIGKAQIFLGKVTLELVKWHP